MAPDRYDLSSSMHVDLASVNSQLPETGYKDVLIGNWPLAHELITRFTQQMITVLIATYHRDVAEYLKVALDSLCGQLEGAYEVLVIEDGPLTVDLERTLDSFDEKMNLRRIRLPENGGLAAALNVGLREAKYPWIMRFDSDDISLPNRFKRQQEVIVANQHDLFGSQIEEFDGSERVGRSRRKVPVDHEEINEFAKRRNPFNHMTVCYRRDLALACGGYPQINLMEDYALWATMLAKGARTMNDGEPLVLARAGLGMINRRGGIGYAASEVRLQRHLYKSGLKGPLQAILDGFLRATVFILPAPIRGRLYQSFLRE